MLRHRRATANDCSTFYERHSVCPSRATCVGHAVRIRDRTGNGPVHRIRLCEYGAVLCFREATPEGHGRLRIACPRVLIVQEQRPLPNPATTRRKSVCLPIRPSPFTDRILLGKTTLLNVLLLVNHPASDNRRQGALDSSIPKGKMEVTSLSLFHSEDRRHNESAAMVAGRRHHSGWCIDETVTVQVMLSGH
ncbi:hypothetical protein MRX96_045589 [Rhipicephalus microplus]